MTPMRYAQVRLEAFARSRRCDVPEPASERNRLPRQPCLGPTSVDPAHVPRYSFVDVTAGTVPASKFTGQAVLIGVTHPVDDVFVTSISSVPMPRVEFHANALRTSSPAFHSGQQAELADVAVIIPALIAIPTAMAPAPTCRSALLVENNGISASQCATMAI
jgi:hypothetical protein